MVLFDDTRADWRAHAPKSTPVKVAPSMRTEFFAHWNGPATGLIGKPHSACLTAVLADQAFHMNGNGWSDIGYNALVCPHARAIEGRGIDAIGAHCPNHNTTGYGVQLMVGKGEQATPAMFARARRLYDDLTARSGHALAKKGHRDGWSTECPGDQIEGWVKVGMPAPAATTTQSEEDDDMKLTDRVNVDRIDGKGNESIEIATLFNRMQFVYGEVLRQRATEAAQTAAIKALADSKGADSAAIVAAVTASVDKALADLSITLTPKES